MTCVTGVSGGGKSTLTIETLYRAAARKLNNSGKPALPHTKASGFEYLDKVIDINQSPIGRTPRSNPATYTGRSPPFEIGFLPCPKPKRAAIKRGGLALMSKAGAAKPAKAAALSPLKCTSLPMFLSLCDHL